MQWEREDAYIVIAVEQNRRQEGAKVTCPLRTHRGPRDVGGHLVNVHVVVTSLEDAGNEKESVWT